MYVNLLGSRALDFTGSDGKAVKGIQLFVSFDEDGVNGQATDKIFIKPEVELPKGIKIGNKLNLSFNRKGKVEAVSIAE